MKIFNRNSASRRRFASFTLFAFLLTFFIHPQLYQSPVLGAAKAPFSRTAASPMLSLMTIGSPITQNFNTLATSGTSNAWADDSTLPGWYAQFTATPTNPTTYRADSGGSNTGAIYSWGVLGTNALDERAFGSVASGTPGDIYYAIKLENNTGSTITSLDVSYIGEQWRQGGCSPTPCTPLAQKLDFQYQVANAGIITDANTPTTNWLDHDALDFTSPQIGTSTAAAIDGNAAANRTALSSTINVTVNIGQEIWLRWKDINDAGNDHGLAIDDFSVTPQGTGTTTPNLSINDVSQTEGDSGTTTFTFNVTLSSAAGAGGVTFDIATADGTAQDGNPSGEDNDYSARSLTGQTIPAGSSGPYSFSVSVNGDTAVEPNETFFVNVTNVTGANVADGQGQGTIINDDVTLTPIHDIQGPGATSPIVGANVTTRGIVTGRKSNGFFIQEPDASVDADPNTSEGIFVFTSSAPPAAATVGNLVQVTATVVEFVPNQDPLQPPLTELVSPSVSLISTGNPLPAAVTLTAAFPDPAGPVDQLERVEAMRVSAPSFTVWAPTGGNVNEPNATATSNGVFFGTITGVPRPFREAGIQAPDPAPSGSIPPIPRWDFNPELLRVDSDGIGAAALNLSTGTEVTGMVGPLDYSFRRYTILPETTPTVSGGATPTAAAMPTASEFTVASYNLERFFDTVNDPNIGEPVLTAAAYDKRLNKASEGIRNFLHTPDILGVVEVENLSTLQDLANRINTDAVAASQPNPQYVAYLVEGNDVGGIDVGFLVKTAMVTGGIPRVEVVEVVQELDGTLFVNPNSTTETLNDRPPLRLTANVHLADGGTYPITVIVNHLRSLNDVESTAPGSNGWATTGDRVRAKRQKQAEDLANLVQARQTANPNERIMLIGDFNAFEFNDGFGDSMGVIEGMPSPDNETVVPGDGVDLVNPDLDNLSDLEPATERYSFIFDGNAQSLDHILVNQALLDSASSVRLDHARINADFPQTARNSTSVERLADHDPLIAYISLTMPVANNDEYSTDEDTPLNVSAPGVLGNDTDSENDALTATLLTNPGNAASFTFNSDGSFSYTPSANFSGMDSFTYKVSDGQSESAAATVEITVNPVNDQPTISSGTITRQQGAGASNSQIAVVGDVEDAASTLTVLVENASTATVNGVTVSNIAVDSSGNVTADVAAALGASDASFTLTVTDSGGASATAVLNVTVTRFYNFTGFFTPISNLPAINTVTAGQTVPIKFSLNGNQGLNIFAAGYPASGVIPCDADEPGAVQQISTAGDSGLSYDAAADQYSLVWKTEKAWKGTCRLLVVRFNDGSEYYAKFRFR
jgi:uncharacterized protein